jgi:hypothetical protein
VPLPNPLASQITRPDVAQGELEAPALWGIAEEAVAAGATEASAATQTQVRTDTSLTLVTCERAPLVETTRTEFVIRCISTALFGCGVGPAAPMLDGLSQTGS